MTTGSGSEEAWDAVGGRLSALAGRLRMHFEQAEAGSPAADEVTDALRQLGGALESAFVAVGAALKDPAVRADAGHLAAVLGDALADTLSEAGQQVAAMAEGLRRSQGEAVAEEPKGPAGDGSPRA